MRFTQLSLLACCLAVSTLSAADPPRVLDDRLKIELFAEHPQIVTPTGIDVDHLGRVWAIESNTHFPPEGYQGHPSDRLLVLEDTNTDGRADKLTVFADGLKHAMSVAVKPVWLEVEALGLRVESQKKKDGATPPSDSQPSTLNSQPTIFLATRREILLLRDTNGDLRADERQRLVHLETKGDYPHNGLAGFAFDALGWMYFGFGENLGESYQIIGNDGVTLSGGGEGGNLYRCRPDGSKLERWATGFWNPHASCFDAFGRLFTVDNDPDSRPPCRLLHIIPGGDYGYRFRNGRKGTHPFTAWNGEIPGTLPMVSGTGEAPSGILCYESDGFPADYLGTLLVGSWGDHRIDKFVLEPKGASFTSKPQPIVQGDENFRPVGLALAPDGSVYFTDWVLRDYKLHGKGRVWRLRTRSSNQARELTNFETATPEQLVRRLSNPMIPVRRFAARRLGALLDGLVNKENPTPTEIDLLRKLTDLEESQHLSERAQYESLMASAAAYGPGDVLMYSKTTPPFTNRVDAAYLRLLDPDFGFSVNEDQQGISWSMRWEEYFQDKPPTPDDPSVWMELARQERSLLWTSLATTCGSGRELYFDAIPKYLNAPDPFVFTALLHGAAREGEAPFRAAEQSWNTPNGLKYEVLTEGLKLLTTLAARRRQPPRQSILNLAISDPSTSVRRAAVQWVGEENLIGYRSRVEAILNDATTPPDLFLACLATLSLLDGVPPSEFEKTPPAQYALAMVVDEQRPAALRATALRLLPPSMPELKGDFLAKLAQSPDRTLQTEAVRTLQQSPRPEALPLLLKLANDADADLSIRADAVSALCAIVPHEKPLPAEVETLLLSLANPRLRPRDSNEQQTLQLEAIRALRGRAGEGSKIGETLKENREAASDDAALREAFDLALTGKSNPQLSALNAQPSSDSQPDAGRRVFFAHQGPLCSKCHTVQGRGGNVGPDLSVIARTMTRQKLIDSILEPSKEISPYFLTWSIATTDGKVHTGLIVSEIQGGDVELGDAQGNVIKIPRKEIDERTPSKVSVMPQGLHQRMTTQEFADLLAYLESLK